MRNPADASKVWDLMRQLGERSQGSGKIYLVGGSSAVLIGWRGTTVDVDLKLHPEPPGAFEAIAAAKDRLAINIELSAPDGFIPELPGWEGRSPYVATFGAVDFHHYDFYAQALAKIARGHARDLSDVRNMHARNLIEAGRLLRWFATTKSELIRFPHLDRRSYESRVYRIAGELGE